MSALNLLHLVSAGAGILVSVLAILFHRFGPASPLLALFLVPGAVVAGILACAAGPKMTLAQDDFRVAFSLLVIAAPGGLIFASMLARSDRTERPPHRRFLLLLIYGLAPIFVAAVFLDPPRLEEIEEDALDYLLLGEAGYLGSLYVLAVSVLAIASLERTLRSASEHVRWELKFLLLGLSASLATLVYLSSRVLLWSFQHSRLPLSAVRVFSVIFVISAFLILVSWRRSSGQSRVRVSQGVVYGSVTFLGVGIYLVASSLVAQWAGTLVQGGIGGIEAEALVFLLSVVLFAAVLLSTRFRHRVRYWIRRHLFAGRYDYRTSWTEATDRLRAIDPLETMSAALAELVERSLGALDVTVWVRGKDTRKLHLLAVRGCTSGIPWKELPRVLDRLSAASGPILIEDPSQGEELDLDAEFLTRTQASLIVPLRSGEETVGMLTVGSDKSGRPFDWQASEFLRVLGRHAAGEIHKAELLTMKVEAKEAEAFRSFSTFLLHDLKNFSSTLSLIARNAARHQGNPDFQRDAFQSIFDTAEKMKRLCNGLRSFSGGLAANKKLDDLNRVVEEVARGADASLHGKIRLSLAQLPLLLIDGEEIARVLQNLILNAAEAISAQGSISITTSARDGIVELTVLDDGKGISKQFLEKELFLPFHTTKSHGLGIGLFQSKKIMEAHGGAIDVESEEAKGTAMRLRFPAAPPGPS